MTTQFPQTFDPTTQEGNSWDILRSANTLPRLSRPPSSSRIPADGYYLAVTWKIIVGDSEGRQIWQRITFLHSSEQAQTIGRKMLKDLCNSTDVAEPIDDAKVFLFKPVRLRLGIEKDKQGVYPDKNRVSRIMPLETKPAEPDRPSRNLGNEKPPR